MSFKMTIEWLKEYYGSLPIQEEQAKNWLETYNKEKTTPEQREEWKIWKHLIEYSVNTQDIVQQCLDKIETGYEFRSELQAHRFVNLMRVPLAVSYEQALEIVKPKTILELGVGGDSGISTSIFLAYIEENGLYLESVDLNLLGVTGKRYEKYLDKIWRFKYDDSVSFLSHKVALLIQRYDMIFIDTSHTYLDTMNELNVACKLTNNMLMDDATFEGNSFDRVQGGVKKAIADWLFLHSDWEKTEFWQGCTVLLRRKI